MIRPITLICMLMAGGSGLYLYQTKHKSQMLDREIGKTVKQTEAARERIGMLRAEWALLNEPDRLSDLAKAHTTLQPLQPTQFVALADLPSKLPAPVAIQAPRPPTDTEMEDQSVPISQAAPASGGTAVASAASRVTPAPTPTQAIAAAAPRPTIAPTPAIATAAAETKPAAVAAAEPAVATETRPAATAHHPPARPAPVQVAAARPALSRPTAIQPVAVDAEATAPGTIGASVLRAMRARGLSAPAARAYVEPAYAPAPPSNYASPSYAAPAPQAYAGPASVSLLGGARSSLPPPVPYAVR